MPRQEFEFGRFRFDADTGLLAGSGEPITLGRRGAALLAALLARRGEVLTKAELIDAAWPDTMVEESNLSVQIAALRQAIGASPAGRDWIVTVPRIGYRFVQETAGHPNFTAGVPAVLPVLVIRPFAGSSGAEAPDGLAAAFVDDLRIGLARFRSFAVAAEAAGDAFYASRVSGACYALEGSIRRGRTELRVSARLIDLTAGLYVWGDRFEGTPSDSPAIQDEIIARVVALVELHLQSAEIARSQRERPMSSEAYDLYLRGQFYLRSSHPADNVVAHRLFNEALRLDPENALYLAGASEAIQHRIALGWGAIEPDDRKLCRELAYRGLRRADSADAGALSLFGMSLYNADEPDRGFAVMQRAMELNPNSIMACLNAGLANLHWGNLTQAEEQLQRAYRLNPLDTLQRFVLSGMARIRMVQGRFDEALGMGGRSLGVNGNYGVTHWTLIAATANMGKADEATRRLAIYRERHPGVTVPSIRAGQPFRHNRSVVVLEGLERAGLPKD